MQYNRINSDTEIYPGQYLYHKPSNQIVLCSVYYKDKRIIKAMANGHFIEDEIHYFRSITLDTSERKKKTAPRRRCGSCKDPKNRNYGNGHG